MRVAIFSLPHNYREELYDVAGPGVGPSFCHDYERGNLRHPTPHGGEWATLPIAMPKCLFVTTDHDGWAIAATADGKHIRWADLDIITKGVAQYNADLDKAGV